MPSQQGGQQQQQVPTMGSTRWCPTPEQLMVLEEMYRGGMRTPTASQIQQITAHLADYGRIEGKNVFYWFQNHKARDRQKLRRRLCMSHHRQLLTCSAQYCAATATHHHHGHGFPATMPVAPAYGCGGGGVFDQPAGAAGVQLLAPTSPSPAAAAAYGYYYPAATTFAAAPTVRCAGDGGTTPPSPNQLFNYHQDGGGVALAPAEALGRPEHSLGKLADNFGVSTTLDDGVEIGPPGFEGSLPSPLTTALCRPLKTLDLFPGGLKEEQQHDVA